MSECTRVMHCPPSDVFDVLADGWSYGLWVVGAARIRAVDPGWPDEGSRIHHSIGVWPALLHDVTHSLGAEPSHRLHLRARAWPTGKADIEFLLEPHEAGCLVTVRENTTSGPARYIPSVVEDPLLRWRNTETLRRLSFISEGRSGSP